MNANLKSRDRELIWPVVGIVMGVLVSINPWYQPQVTLGVGIAAWFADLTLALALSACPRTVRLGSVATGLFLAVPCFLRGLPLSRALLMCCMAFPFVIAAAALLASPTSNSRERLTFLFTWLGTREVKRRPRRFDTSSLLHLVGATLVLVAAMASVKGLPAGGPWLLARWLTGGIMILAFAETLTAGHNLVTAFMGVRAPTLMQSPYLARSLAEFWTKRWNPAASFLIFRTFCFVPCARRGAGVALCAAFFASAVAHVLLPFMASGEWSISLACGAFFMVQPLFIITERRLNVRHWRPAAARVWTLGALAISSPLFVEPALQLIEPSWGAPDDLLSPTLAVLSSVAGLTVFWSLGSLAVGPERAFPKKRVGLRPVDLA